MPREFGGPSPKEMGKEMKRIQISKEELDKFRNMSIDNPELHSWMEEKGISFDQGLVEIEVDGVNYLFETGKVDFGTTSYPEDVIMKGE